MVYYCDNNQRMVCASGIDSRRPSAWHSVQSYYLPNDQRRTAHIWIYNFIVSIYIFLYRIIR